jgi:hypothetical protein
MTSKGSLTSRGGIGTAFGGGTGGPRGNSSESAEGPGSGSIIDIRTSGGSNLGTVKGDH